MHGTSLSSWLIFGGIIVAAVAADFALLHRTPHRVTLKQAMVEIALWVTLALAFGVWIYFSRGPQAGAEFLTAYVVEKSLSIDNIFVFLLIFRAFEIPERSQHKVLYSGLAGAVAFRAGFILAGMALLRKIHFALYVFAAILVVTGVRMIFTAGRQIRPEGNWVVRLARKFHPIADDPTGEHFWVQKDGRWNATPLFLALLAVEGLDIIFAVDSVPAVLAITRDTFIAYSSNVFAILGLRAMYFGLAGILPRMRFLHHGLAAILIFIGVKMLVSEHFAISTAASLSGVALILALAVLASLAWPSPNPTREAE
jgi:tellurite resistance protein TerC